MFNKIFAVAPNPLEFGLQSHISLFNYQVVGIKALTEANFRILCDEMGLGKTIQMIGVLYRWLSPEANPFNLPALIVVPSKELADQWKGELITKSSFANEGNIIIIDKVSDLEGIIEKQKENPQELNGKLIITTYEVIKENNSQKCFERRTKSQPEISPFQPEEQAFKDQKRLSLEPDQESHKRKRIKAGFIEFHGWFGRQIFQVLICDEIHKIGSILSYKFDGLKPSEDSHGINANIRYALTGTPIIKTMHEIVATIGVTDNHFNWQELKNDLVEVSKSMGYLLGYLKSSPSFRTFYYTQDAGFKTLLKGNKDSIQNAIAQISKAIGLMIDRYVIRNFEVVKGDFLESSAPLLRRNYSIKTTVLELPESPELQVAIKNADTGFQQEWYCEKGASTMFHVSGKRSKVRTDAHTGQDCEQSSKNTVFSKSRDGLFKHKVELLKQVLPQLTEPIIITVDIIKEITEMRKKLSALGYTVYTKETIEGYKHHCQQHNPQSAPPILVILQTTTGLNITEAKNMIIFDQPKSQADIDQVKARIDRIGQTSDIHFFQFAPVTKIDKLYDDICRLQHESMALLVNPKTFLQNIHDDTETDIETQQHTKIAIFFLAKAIHELIHRNVSIDELQGNAVLTSNIQALQSLPFKTIFQLLVTDLKQRQAQNTSQGGFSLEDLSQFGDLSQLFEGFDNSIFNFDLGSLGDDLFKDLL